MNKIILSFFLALSCMAATVSARDSKPIPAFPGAEGFGRYTVGGRGGKVYHVTTLDDNELRGSLRHACTQSGARIIVFDVCGTIYLKKPLYVTNDSCTIAGQTAPGDGICIADFPFGVRANNVIVRYMRFRCGNRMVNKHTGDSFACIDHHDIIIDHCSMSWAVDECLSMYGGTNTTVQWCIIAQSLYNAGHPKGAHGYAGNWGGSGATFAHNLLAHHGNRTPRFNPRPSTQTDERVDMRNNVIFNWSGEGCFGGEGMDINIVNNYYKPGPGTMRSADRIIMPGIRTSSYCGVTEWNQDGTPAKGNQWLPMWHRWGHFYVTGNFNSKFHALASNNWLLGVAKHISTNSNDGTATPITLDTIHARNPVLFPYTTTWSAEEAYEKVLSYAGCCMTTYKHKAENQVKGYALQWDSYDQTIINDVRNGVATYTSRDSQSGIYDTPGIINTQTECGGWPELYAHKSEYRRASEDIDFDGIPDYYERKLFGRDINPKAMCRIEGFTQYTNMDYYLAYLCHDFVTRNISGEYMSGSEVRKCRILGNEAEAYEYEF
ncbi:MAG: pectate lyase [Bacteroidales bacterium]|nr:pectate lyase [Bacteroidales bacterium]